MAGTDPGGFVERLQFFNGQRLFAADLQQLEAFHRTMRELHNASCHQAGLGAGLAVCGEPGDREVVVGPGYALDVDGHEIVLSRDHTEPVPPVDGDPDGTPAVYDLVISYPDDDLLEVVETRAGICAPRGAVRLREEPVFCWVRLREDGSGVLSPENTALGQDIAVGRRLVLARAEVQHCKLKRLSIAERRNARPPTQPMIACGRAAPAWQVTMGPSSIFGLPSLSLEATISTKTAGFINTPCYSARLDGPRDFEVTNFGNSIGFQADGFLSIHSAKPDEFTVRVIVPGLFPNLFLVDVDDLETFFSVWTIEWMGVD